MNQPAQIEINEALPNTFDTSIEYELLENPTTEYTQEQKVEAVTLFMVTHNMTEVSDKLGIPITTISNWKNRSTWWNELTQQIRKEKQLELDSLLTKTIHKAVDQLVDRLEHGDYKVDRQGDLLRVPINARDLATTLSVIYEKRALIRGEATAIRAESQVTLQSLEDKFKKFALDLKEKDVVSNG